MTKPASTADLIAQGATDVDLFSGDIESFRLSNVVVLNLLDDQSARAATGVNSFLLHDMEDLGMEDTKVDGSEQSDLSGGAIPTKLTISENKTAPSYFYYKLGEESRIDWVASFVEAAPQKAILQVEEAAIAALRGIGANSGHFRQLSGSDSAGSANTVPTVSDYKFAINKLVQEMKLNKMELRSLSSETGSLELNTIFDMYDKEATGAMGEFAKMNGYARQILGIPHYSSSLFPNNEFVIFHRRAVAYAIRTMAELRFEGQASKSRDYYGVAISYGVVARQDNRAVVMQSGASFAA